MTFLEALPLLVNGARFRRPEWEPGVWIEHYPLLFDDEFNFTVNDGLPWYPSITDVLATDWEVQMTEPTKCECCGRTQMEIEPCRDCGLLICEMCRGHLKDGTTLCWGCKEEYYDEANT